MQRSSAPKLLDLKKVRRQRGLSQMMLARQLGVSQSTVSRRERKPPQRHSEATFRLCSYAVATIPKVKAAKFKAVQQSFYEIWNKSDAHAAALSNIIDAMVELCKSDNPKEEKPG